RKDITVFSNLKMEWGIGNLENPAPDISIVSDVEDPEKPRGTFSVPEEGVGPFFVLEMVSPRYRRPDTVDKPVIYRKAGVSEYIIADPGLRKNEISYTVRGYRLIGNRYVKISPDPQGRIYSRTTDVWIGTNESRDRLVVYDGQTDEPILPDEERAEVAEIRAEQAEIRAEQAEIRAEQAENWVEQEKKQAEQEKKRAEQEKKRAEQSENRAEQSENRADSEKQRADILAAKLRELGIDPGNLK
ncbi:MAG: hypothetical protein GY749_32460, partial [Desulfobacteraceae bacterium]|nr:hypothetical protein [Desulfobacteraceae bacterium]